MIAQAINPTKLPRIITKLPLLVTVVCGVLAQPPVALAQGWDDTTNPPHIFNTNTGNVGIGTTTPGYNLHVFSSSAAMIAVRGSGTGSLDSGSIRFGNSTGDDNALIFLAGGGYVGQGGPNSLNLMQRLAAPMTFLTNSAERMRIDWNGNVGIGTTAPSAPLHVLRSSQSQLRLESTDAAATDTAVDFAVPGVSGSPRYVLGINVFGLGADKFFLWHPASPTVPRLTVDNAGNVGIGTATPTAKLQVNGTVTGTNIQAQYQDLAEWVPARGTLLPGTVVALDPGQSNQVVSSSRAYDTRVAGVVSERPGLLLGEGGEGKVKVATTGRVKVKVDATRAPIHVGDLLVTSGKEGVAMRSEPLDLGGIPIHRPGTLIGKALEPMEKGEGEILVLLTLQ